MPLSILIPINRSDLIKPKTNYDSTKGFITLLLFFKDRLIYILHSSVSSLAMLL